MWGEYVAHSHTSRKNLINALICLCALAPSIVATWAAYSRCSPDGHATATLAEAACSCAMVYPIAFANLLFFLNVSLLFWLIGLAQRSFWLIDPYWTLIPPLLGHLYQLHPNARFNEARSALALALLWVWSLRLSHNYFRREDWKFGQREDWRYTKMAKDMPRSWPLVSFVAVGVAQQPMLVGLTLPAYAVHFVDAPLCWCDAVAAVGAVAGLLVAWSADNELRRYMLANEELMRDGKPRRPLLQSGLWRWSRHPNYFGEQLFWWSFGGLAVGLGQWYLAGGALFNSLVLASVTVMTERRMLDNWPTDRAALYREYMRSTSACVPLPRSPWWGAQAEGRAQQLN